MKIEDFNNIVEYRLRQCRSILVPKGEEYSRNGDRLWNFKRAGELLGCTPERALLGMWTKHLISIMDIIDDLDLAIIPSDELMNEKFNDAINYVMLLEALIKDYRNLNKPLA